MVRVRTVVAYSATIILLQVRTLARFFCIFLRLHLVAALLLFSRFAVADTLDAKAKKGLELAKRGDCIKAIPLLEEAELARHRPSSAVALADCYVATGELLHASEIYHAVATEKPARTSSRADQTAVKQAKRKATQVDARIPTVRFESAEPYEDFEIELGGRVLSDPYAEKRVAPDTAISLVARAKGRKEFRDKLVLNEGERRKVKIVLKRLGGTTEAVEAPRGGKDKHDKDEQNKDKHDKDEQNKDKHDKDEQNKDKHDKVAERASKPEAKASSRARKEPPIWLGARYRGVVLPQFWMDAFADGGTTLLVPGGGLTLTVPTSDIDISIGIDYMSYRMGDTPFKPNGAPDSEWEFIASDLNTLTLSLDLLWSFPLDAKGDFTFRLGGGVGVGWSFYGELYRSQVYPPDGKPGDPSAYLKCRGPNNPRGTYRYCNTLDKDAKHYNDYPAPDWFNGGLRPLIFPWLVIPEIGLSWRVSRGFALDLMTGATLSGILTSFGGRFAL